MYNKSSKKIDKIAAKLPNSNKNEALEAAKEVNQLAILLIELRKNNVRIARDQ